MEILLELFKKIPPGRFRWLFVFLAITIYFAPTLYAKFVSGSKRREKLNELKTLLEIKLLSLEIAEKEGRIGEPLSSIADAKSLAVELFDHEALEKTIPLRLKKRDKMKYGLTGSLSIVFILIILNLWSSSAELSTGWLITRDITIGVLAGMATAWYPSDRRKVLLLAGMILPLVIALGLFLLSIF